MFFFLQGLIIGISSMAPIGMQNLFVINTALAQTTMRVLITVAIVIFFDMTLSLFRFLWHGGPHHTIPIAQITSYVLRRFTHYVHGVSNSTHRTNYFKRRYKCADYQNHLHILFGNLGESTGSH